MKQLSTILIAAFSIIQCLGSEEVLYWMVTDQATVHYGNEARNIVEIVPETLDTTLAARVRVTGGNLVDDTFLMIYIGDGERWDGEFGIDFDDPGDGYWGVGNPTGVQSPLAPYVVSDPNSPEYHFIMELGNYDWNNDNWTTVASSAALSYSNAGNYIFNTFDMGPPQMRIWNPTHFYATVPEPSTSLLVLVGFSLLLLGRRTERC